MTAAEREREIVREHLRALPPESRKIVLAILDRAHKRAGFMRDEVALAQRYEAVITEWREKCEQQARRIAQLEGTNVA